jgi:glycosyltransferase involved in cell wall biosynthesis
MFALAQAHLLLTGDGSHMCTRMARPMMPLISVVVPLYNKAEFVLATVRSAVAQIDAEFEIIVVDDGSTDGGAGLLRSLNFPRLRLIEQVNSGVSAARNRAILAAQGKWIAFLDADDVWSPHHLASLLNAVTEGGVIGAFSNCRLQSRGSAPLIDRKIAAQKIDDYFSFALSNGGYPIATSALMIMRDELIAAGLFAEGVSTGEDIDMWCRLAYRGPFSYSATISATYNDAPSETSIAREAQLARPIFAQRLPCLIRCATVPPSLIDSSKRYANFLMLEHARRLLDAGKHVEARAVLLNDCIPRYDLIRFTKRFARTWSFGRYLFRLSRQIQESS